MIDLFAHIYDYLQKRKWLCYSLFFGSLLLWIALSFQIKLQQNISDMLPDSRSVKAMNEIISKSKAAEQIIFSVKSNNTNNADADSLIAAAEQISKKIAAQLHEYVDTITLRPADETHQAVLFDIIQQNLPLFLTAQDYQKLDSNLRDSAMLQTMQAHRKLSTVPMPYAVKKFIIQDPVGISAIVLPKLKNLQNESSYTIYEGYLLNEAQDAISFFIKPHYAADETGKNIEFFELLDALLQEWEIEHPGLEATYFGGSAVAAGNAKQLKTDTLLTLSITVILLLVLTYYYFRKKRTPFLLFIPVAYGAFFGLAWVYIIKGTMAVIALGAGTLVLGIAIDFSIHFLSHARFSKNIRTTISEMSHPLTVGSFTTIAAFLSLTWIDTPILQDLGLFAGMSLLGAALCTLIFLPHFSSSILHKADTITLFDKLGTWKPEKNKWLVVIILILTPVLYHFAKKVSFDSDLMHLNFLSKELKAAQDEISQNNASALSAIYIIANGKDESAAIENLQHINPTLDSLSQQQWIRNISNPTQLIPSKGLQQERIERWNRFWTKDRKQQTIQSIHRLYPIAGYTNPVYKDFENWLSQDFDTLNHHHTSFLKTLYPAGFAADKEQFFAIAALRVDKKYRQQVISAFKHYPDITITDRQQTATQLVDILKTDFNKIAVYSSCIVFFALLIGYGRLELAIISFLPMVISWIWILGLMALLGLKFNIVNIIISSLIFGLGDDYAIFTMDGLVEKYKTGKNKLSHTRAAVFISVTTVIIGLGVLLLAKHPALKSIAFISVTGLLCVLFISQTLQPFLFNWFIQHRADKKFLPFTLWSFAKSVFSFTYFFVGSFILTVTGPFFTKFFPFGKERGKYLYHVFLSKYSWSLMHIMRNIRVKEFNRTQNDFSKPAVYIANHGSFLDILCTTMLHPKLILLTNKWTWRSPIFGAVVRMAEYYPVADGAEGSVKPLRDLVDNGYSIMVFPESRRSYDDTIKRFHKGAFYIAEQLKLDIVPLVLHGIQYTMQKGDWLLKDGSCFIYYYPRIKEGDKRIGKNYSETTKKINQWFRETYASIKEKNETPSYFREQLLRSYTYKGPGLEWYCRIKTKLENNYEFFHQLLPRKGVFYDLGCGYGFMSYMLHWAAPERQFTAMDYDEEKIDIAQNNLFKTDAVAFIYANLNQVQLNSCDGIIISDVLHYLLPEQQAVLLEKCVNALPKGGMLIIRDGITELQDRIGGTKKTEYWSTKLMRFNKVENKLYYISKKSIEAIAQEYQLHLTIHDHSKHTANLIFVLEKK